MNDDGYMTTNAGKKGSNDGLYCHLGIRYFLFLLLKLLMINFVQIQMTNAGTGSGGQREWKQAQTSQETCHLSHIPPHNHLPQGGFRRAMMTIVGNRLRHDTS